VPAFAFNAVEVNDGRRFLISNYSVPVFSSAPCDIGLGFSCCACPPSPHPARAFLDVCPNLDISLYTAARLSASFPYVSPVAVAKLPDELTTTQTDDNHFCADQHLADGGYYDNDGMDAAMEFLWSAFGYKESELAGLSDAAQQAEKLGAATKPPGERTDERKPCPHQGQRPCIVVVEIRHTNEPQDEPPPAPSAGFGHVAEQLVAPPKTVLGAWEMAQPLRNQEEYRFLKDALRDKVDFNHLVFSFVRADGACPTVNVDWRKEKDPESWHLTPRAKELIQCEWDNIYKSEAERFAAAFPELP